MPPSYRSMLAIYNGKMGGTVVRPIARIYTTIHRQRGGEVSYSSLIHNISVVVHLVIAIYLSSDVSLASIMTVRGGGVAQTRI